MTTKTIKSTKQAAQKQETVTPAADPGGTGLAGLLSSPLAGEFIKHLLSGGGAALFSYLTSIKPMQEKIEILTSKLEKQERRIREMRDEQDNLKDWIKEILKQKKEEELDGDDNEYFSTKKNKYLSGQNRSRKYLDV